MKLRSSMIAVILSLGLVATGAACSRVPVAAVRAAAVTTVSVATVTVTASPPSLPVSPSQRATAPADTENTARVERICTRMGTVNESVDSKPQLAENSSVGTIRQAMVDYYASFTKTVSAAYDDSKTLAPPTVADGEAIHRAYQHFLSGLGDIFYQAALDRTDATDLAAIRKVNDAVDQHITALGSNNAALQAMSSGALADVAEAIPACGSVTDTAGSI